MGDAEGQLGEGNADGAGESQGRALDALRRGAQNLAQALQHEQGDGKQHDNGPVERVGRQQNSGPDADPLGRPLRGREFRRPHREDSRRDRRAARAPHSRGTAPPLRRSACGRSSSSIISSACSRISDHADSVCQFDANAILRLGALRRALHDRALFAVAAAARTVRPPVRQGVYSSLSAAGHSKTEVFYGDGAIIRTAICIIGGQRVLETTQYEGLFQLDRVDRAARRIVYKPKSDLAKLFPLKPKQKIDVLFDIDAKPAAAPNSVSIKLDRHRHRHVSPSAPANTTFSRSIVTKPIAARLVAVYRLLRARTEARHRQGVQGASSGAHDADQVRPRSRQFADRVKRSGAIRRALRPPVRRPPRCGCRPRANGLVMTSWTMRFEAAGAFALVGEAGHQQDRQRRESRARRPAPARCRP